MKKRVLSLFVTAALVLGLAVTMAFAQDETTDAVAQVGDTTYPSLSAAVDAVVQSENKTGTVTLLKDSSGGGIGLFGAQGHVGVNLTIDFGGHTYTCQDPAVGSTGTASQGFHLETGNTVTLKNGSICVAQDSANTKMLIQSYCNLSLENLSLMGSDVTEYMISCNYGDVSLNNVTIDGTHSGLVALDVMHWLGTQYADKAPTVTVVNDSNHYIKGDIDVYCYGAGAASCTEEPSLSVTGGTVQVADEEQLNDAIAYASGATVALTQDITLTKSVQLAQGTDVTIEGNGHALRFAFEGVNSPAVFGSNTSGVPANVNLTVKNAVLENTNGTQQGYGVLTAIDATNTNITLDNCTFKNLYCGAYINPIKSADNQGVLSIVGCTYENTKYGFSVDEVTEGACMDAMGVRFEGNSGIQQVEEVWNNVVYVNGVSYGSGTDALVNAAADAESGSTILLAPGEYDGDVFFYGKDITIRAMYPAYQNGVKEAEENLSKFYGTFNTSNGSDPSNFVADQTVVIEGIALAGDGLKIGNCNYNAVGNLEVRYCTMECGANETPATAWNGLNYFVKVSGTRNENYASVVIEDNYVSGTPAPNVYPIQAWQVDNVVIRNNVMELTQATDREAIGVSSMAADAKVEITGNTISGAGCAISVTTWYVGGTTEADLGTFAGDIVIQDNVLDCANSTEMQFPIFVGAGEAENHGYFGGTLSVSGNTNHGIAVGAEIGWKDGQTKEYVVTLVSDGAVVEQYMGQAQITLPKYDKKGYEFLGWLADGQEYAAGQSVAITKDMTFVAQWKEVVEVSPTEEPQTSQQPTQQPSAQPSEKPNGVQPDTGDATNLTIWVALMVVCLGTLTSVSLYTKKRG